MASLLSQQPFMFIQRQVSNDLYRLNACRSYDNRRCDCRWRRTRNGKHSVSEWSYVILERDEEGTIVDSADATSEVLFLYAMIERQERIIESYRKDLGITLFEPSSLTKH